MEQKHIHTYRDLERNLQARRSRAQEQREREREREMKVLSAFCVIFYRDGIRLQMVDSKMIYLRINNDNL